MVPACSPRMWVVATEGSEVQGQPPSIQQVWGQPWSQEIPPFKKNKHRNNNNKTQTKQEENQVFARWTYTFQRAIIPRLHSSLSDKVTKLEVYRKTSVYSDAVWLFPPKLCWNLTTTATIVTGGSFNSYMPQGPQIQEWIKAWISMG